MIDFPRKITKHLKRCWLTAPFIEQWKACLYVILVVGGVFIVYQLIGADTVESNWESFSNAQQTSLVQTFDTLKRGLIYNLSYGGKHTLATIYLIAIHFLLVFLIKFWFTHGEDE